VRARGVVVGLIVLALVGLGGYALRVFVGDGLSLPDVPASCEVTSADGDPVRLDGEQTANAATIAAVGRGRGLPGQAVVVALATSLQEAKLRNLDHLGRHNDHDSLGLFQQRPSQGWGTAEQILDQRHAAESFYTALVRVRGWEKMRVTDAAQQVQRSAHPEAYEKWADEARVLTAALTGRQGAAVMCTMSPRRDKAGPAAAEAAANQLRQDFGAQAPMVVTEEQTLRVAVTDRQTGWQVAHWLVAHSGQTGVTKVAYADKQWSADHATWSATDKDNEELRAEVPPAR
jgi:hypothetical protein